MWVSEERSATLCRYRGGAENPPPLAREDYEEQHLYDYDVQKFGWAADHINLRESAEFWEQGNEIGQIVVSVIEGAALVALLAAAAVASFSSGGLAAIPSSSVVTWVAGATAWLTTPMLVGNIANAEMLKRSESYSQKLETGEDIIEHAEWARLFIVNNILKNVEEPATFFTRGSFMKLDPMTGNVNWTSAGEELVVLKSVDVASNLGVEHADVAGWIHRFNYGISQLAVQEVDEGTVHTLLTTPVDAWSDEYLYDGLKALSAVDLLSTEGVADNVWWDTLTNLASDHSLELGLGATALAGGLWFANNRKVDDADD